MSLISSDTLFHFTGALTNLVGILRDEFRPRLSVENFEYITQYLSNSVHLRESGIPMVCFCDIPLSQVGTHMEHYGCYGIGLRKSWGIAKGISPVTYVHPKSPAPQSVAKLVQLLETLAVSKAAEDVKHLALQSGQLVYFLKAYEGVLIRPDRVFEDVRFYNEREWRYIPSAVEGVAAISRADLSDPNKSALVRSQVDQLPPLSFDPSDINYILVASEDEVLPMFYAIDQIKEKYKTEEKDLLKTKIISAERIKKDF